MKTLYTLLFVILTVISFAKVSNETVYFDKASFEINEKELHKLQDFSSATKIILKGHTDQDGDEKYNLNLSKNRVEEVKQLLIQQGIDERAIEISYFGESNPLNQNLDENEMSINRRVEIVVSDDPLLGFYKEKQQFTFNNSKDTTIVGEEGTVVFIPAMAFDGKSVKISLQEFYSLEDILSANLNTHAGENLLETAGMIYLEATDIESNIPVNPSIPISITYATELEDKNGYQLFDGEFDENMIMDWTASSQNNSTNQMTQLRNRSENYLNYLILRMSNQEIKLKLSEMKMAIRGIEFSDEKNNEVLSNVINKKVFYVENPQCFEGARAIIPIQKNGGVFKPTTSHGETDINCDTLMKNALKFGGATNYTEQTQSYSVDFVSIDLATDDEVEAYRDSIAAILARDPYYSNLLAYAETDNLLFSTMKLGWINCDRFYSIENPTILAIHTKDNAQIRVVFKNISSIMSAQSIGGEARLGRVPLGAEIIIVVTKMNEDVAEYAMLETKVTKEPIELNDFQVFDAEVLSEKLKKAKS